MRYVEHSTNRMCCRIFIICGASTMGKHVLFDLFRHMTLMHLIATGVLAFILIPKSPRHTGRLLGGLIHVRGWLSDREADIFIARVIKADPTKGQASTMKITLKDM